MFTKQITGILFLINKKTLFGELLSLLHIKSGWYGLELSLLRWIHFASTEGDVWFKRMIFAISWLGKYHSLHEELAFQCSSSDFAVLLLSAQELLLVCAMARKFFPFFESDIVIVWILCDISKLHDVGKRETEKHKCMKCPNFLVPLGIFALRGLCYLEHCTSGSSYVSWQRARIIHSLYITIRPKRPFPVAICEKLNNFEVGLLQNSLHFEWMIIVCRSCC